MKPSQILLATLLVLGGSAVAQAQDLRNGLLRRFDADRDGRLSATERDAARDYLLERRDLSGRREPGARFRRQPTAGEPGAQEPQGLLGRLRARYDLDGDGTLDATEATRARQMWRQLRARSDRATLGTPGFTGRRTATSGRRSSAPGGATPRPDPSFHQDPRVGRVQGRRTQQETPFERGFGRVPGTGRSPAPQQRSPQTRRQQAPAPRVAPTPRRAAPTPQRVAPSPRRQPQRPQAQPQRRSPAPAPRQQQQRRGGQQRRGR